MGGTPADEGVTAGEGGVWVLVSGEGVGECVGEGVGVEREGGKECMGMGGTGGDRDTGLEASSRYKKWHEQPA